MACGWFWWLLGNKSCSFGGGCTKCR